MNILKKTRLEKNKIWNSLKNTFRECRIYNKFSKDTKVFIQRIATKQITLR